MNNTKLFVAGKAFIEYKGKILVLRESNKYGPGTNAGQYDVPGGRIRPDEKFFDALKREITEEVGVKVKIGSPFYVGEWFPKPNGEKWHVVGVFFQCVASSDKVKLSKDHDDYRWVDPKNLGKIKLIDNLKLAFKEYLQCKK